MARAPLSISEVMNIPSGLVFTDQAETGHSGLHIAMGSTSFWMGKVRCWRWLFGENMRICLRHAGFTHTFKKRKAQCGTLGGRHRGVVGWQVAGHLHFFPCLYFFINSVIPRSFPQQNDVSFSHTHPAYQSNKIAQLVNSRIVGRPE